MSGVVRLTGKNGNGLAPRFKCLYPLLFRNSLNGEGILRTFIGYVSEPSINGNHRNNGHGRFDGSSLPRIHALRANGGREYAHTHRAVAQRQLGVGSRAGYAARR